MAIGEIFSVQVSERDFSDILTPGNLAFKPTRLIWRAIGGPAEATIGVSGPKVELWKLVERLRCPVSISALGDVIWSGYIESATIKSGKFNVTVSLESMSNRVCVTYAEVNTAGTVGERKTTTWYQDDDSVATYGTKEQVLSLSQGTAEEAENRAQTKLSQLRYPMRTVSLSGAGTLTGGQVEAEPSAEITCKGWWSTLGWKKYQNLNGKESYEEAGSGLMALGKGVTTNVISFETGDTQKIKATDKTMTKFSANEVIYVSGSTSNNGTYTISSIRDVDGGGSYAIVEEAVVNEAAGDNVTMRSATKTAQSFQINTAEGWLGAFLRIRVKKEGDPQDNLTISLCADAAGLPGSALASGSLAGTAVDENLNWVEAALSSRVMLEPGTSYWIVVERSGAIDADNYYKVDANEDLGYSRGAMKIYDGATWVDRVPDADMLFQVGGVAETSDQVSEMIGSGQFFSGQDVFVASGIYSSPYREGDQSALNCIEELLGSGTTNLRRMMATVDDQRRVLVSEEPVEGSADYLLYENEELHDPFDRTLQKWAYPAGVWARLVDVIPGGVDTSRVADPSIVFIEEVTYEAETDDVSWRERDYNSLLEVE